VTQDYYPEAGAGAADVHTLVNSYKRHLWLFALVFVVVTIAVASALMFQPKQYTATAQVFLIAPDRVQLQDNVGYKPGGDTQTTSYVETQAAALKSPDVAAAVVDNLGLVNDPEFNPAKSGQTPQMARQSTIASVLRHSKIRRMGQTFTAEVGFTSRDPIKAAKIANAIANTFIQIQQDMKAQSAREANALIAAQLDPLRSDVEKAENAVAQYKAAHGLMTSNGGTFNEQEMSSLTQQLALTRAAEAEADARLAAAKSQMKSSSGGADVGEALNSEVVRQLRQQRAEQVTKLADLENRLGPRHPQMVAARQQLADIDNEIHAEVVRQVSNLEAQAQIAHERNQAVVSSLNASRGNIATNDLASVKLDELQRDADAAKALYETSLAKSKQTSQAQEVSQADAQVAVPATPPIGPSSPNKPLDALLGMMVGFAAGATAVVVRRLFDSTLRTQEEVERQLGVHYLASIPTVVSALEKPTTKNPIEAILKHPLSGFAEAFRSLGTAGIHPREDQTSVIAITSSLPNEGKTTTTICLAEVLAMGGARVVVLDCDLRRRSVNEELKVNAQYGLLDVLRGERSIDDALHVDEQSGVSYLLLPRQAVASARSPLDDKSFDDLLAELRTRFTHVIVDTPPLLPIVDTRRLASRVDGVILLVRWQQTPRKAVQHSVRLLQDAGANLSGVALTLVNLKAQKRYGYGDASYYYHGYKDYYLEAKQG
jgi:capsular exopolysaccharide synthesis family protein